METIEVNVLAINREGGEIEDYKVNLLAPPSTGDRIIDHERKRKWLVNEVYHYIGPDGPSVTVMAKLSPWTDNL